MRHVVKHSSPLLLAVLLSFTAAAAHAAGEIAQPAQSAPSASASAGAAMPVLPLPELPKLAPITNPEPDPGSLQDLDRLLERFTADDARARTDARAAIAEVGANIVPAVRARVQEIRASLDRHEAQQLLDDARKAGRKGLRDKDKAEGKSSKDKKDKPEAGKSKDKPAEGKGGKDKPAEGKGAKAGKDGEDDGDWLDFLLAMPRPKDDTWRDLVRLLAMERMLTAAGTTPAIRELIQLYSYFGDLVRIDLQRQVGKLRDRAVPALIEARQHDAKIVQRWASKQLDVLGRAIPGEAVGVTDPQVLADVLRAYGRTRDVDAVRVVLSFCNSDRIQLRESARESIAAIGEPGIWQLRDAYLNQTGNKAPREFTWDRIARELFAMYDRARLAEVYKLMDDGAALSAAGKYAEATEAFDKVLARSPVFERRKEMVSAYVERAKQLEDKQREDALAMFRKALRLDPKGEGAKKIEAEIAYLEGALLIEQGTPDKFPLTRALELDPGNDRARQALASLEQEKVAPKKSQLHRYVAAGGVGLLALVAMILLARRRDAVAPAGAAPAGALVGGGPTSPSGDSKTADGDGAAPEA